MITIKDAIVDFILHCRHEKNLSEKTQKFYEIDLKQFLIFLENESYSIQIELIDKSIVKNYVYSMSEFKPKTIKRKIATLKAFFNLMEFEDRIIASPFRKIRIKIKEPKTLPIVMTISEIRKIFKAAYAKRNIEKIKTPYGKFEIMRNIAVVELLFASGVRVSELSNLKEDAVDLQAGLIKVKGKGNKERVIQICNSETISILKEYARSAKDYRNVSTTTFFVNRFNTRLSEQSIRYIVKNLASLAEVKKRITPHVFRHSIATLLLEEGVDIKYIQDILGHSSIMTTQIYTHVNAGKLKGILTNKHPRKHFTMNSIKISE